MSEVEFVVLTVLISVWVNDSAPSLGTHYSGGWVMGRVKDGVCKVKTDRNIAYSVYTVFLPFWFNFKSLSLHFLLLSFFLSPQIPFAFFHTFKSGLMLRGAELISSVA